MSRPPKLTFREYVSAILCFGAFAGISSAATLAGIGIGAYATVIAKYIVVGTSLLGVVGASYAAVRLSDFLERKLAPNK